MSLNPQSYRYRGWRAGDVPEFESPRIIGSFHVDGNRRFVNSAEGLAYYRPEDFFVESSNKEARLGSKVFDLKTGYPNNITLRNEEEIREEYLKLVQQWIIQNLEKLSTNPEDSSKLDIDFVSGRGIFTKILSVPYEKREGMKVLATLHKGTIYMHKSDELNRPISAGEASTTAFWGHKFKHFVSYSKPNSKPDPQQHLNMSEEFCAIFKSKFGPFTMVYGAQMDAVLDNGEAVDQDTDTNILNERKFVEFKTNRTIEHGGHERTLKAHKMMKWWSQGYVVNVQDVIVGFREENGLVTTLKSYKNSNLPKIGAGFWDKNVCLKFLQDFLVFVKKSIVNEDVVYTFEYEPLKGGNVSVTIDNSVSVDKILPKFYLDALKEL